MIPRYDGALDPLSPDELRRRIANCDAVIGRLTAKGLTRFIPEWRRRKRQYQRRLERHDKRGRVVPMVMIKQITDEDWQRRARHEEEVHQH